MADKIIFPVIRIHLWVFPSEGLTNTNEWWKILSIEYNILENKIRCFRSLAAETQVTIVKQTSLCNCLNEEIFAKISENFINIVDLWLKA